MTRCLISFNDGAMDHIPAEDMMLSPTAADDIVRFFTPRPTEPAPAD